MILLGMVSPISVHDLGAGEIPLLGIPIYLSNNVVQTNITKTTMTTLMILFIVIIFSEQNMNPTKYNPSAFLLPFLLAMAT